MIVTKPLAGFAFHQLFQLFQLKSKRTNKQKYQIQRLQKESTELVANIPGVSPDEPNAYGWIVGLGGKLKSLPLPPDAFAEFAIVKTQPNYLGSSPGSVCSTRLRGETTSITRWVRLRGCARF